MEKQDIKREITRITSIRITDIIKGGAASEDNSKEYYAEALVSQIKELIGPDDVVVDNVQDFALENVPYTEKTKKIDGWIPLAQRKPDIKKKVLLSLRDLDICVGYRETTGSYFLAETGGYIEADYVLAWQLLPSPYSKGDSEVPHGKAD